MAAKNQVVLAGKVSKIHGLKYTPAGICVGELVLAVQQAYLDKASVGYFDVVASGNLAQLKLAQLKIGSVVEVVGKLWCRSYKNRQGVLLNETKIIAEEIEPISEKQVT